MNSSNARPRTILLFAEAVTLAHVARPLCFAQGLRRDRYRVVVAVSPRASAHVRGGGFEHVDLQSIEPRRFLAALARGRPLYDASVLQRYVEEDVSLIERLQPDLVVGDFRLSLSVSARLARVPYMTITSAYWSPYYVPPRWTVPSLPLTRVLPIGLAQTLFSAARPLAFALHCGPLNEVRRQYGLPALPRDLRRIYTDADRVAYSDLPELFPTAHLPAGHAFIGPALWEPAGPLPSWWNDVPGDRPAIYVTLGSSGDATLLPRIIDALAGLPVSLLVARGGANLPETLPRGVFAAQYLPGMRAAGRSRLVICNGGSLTAYQALAGGAKLIGIAGNLDQFLNMQGFELAGIGRTLRADRFSVPALRAMVEALLEDGPAPEQLASLRRACVADRMATAAGTMADELTA